MEYDMMIWCDFTTQLNDLIDQILPYGRFAWGNDANKFATTIGAITFETVNTVGEDRLVRASMPLTVLGTLLSEQEARVETIRKAYSLKKVSFDTVVDVGNLNIFRTTQIPLVILQNQQQVLSGGSVVVSGGGSTVSLNAVAMAYLTTLTDKQATYVNATTVTVAAYAAINPVTNTIATVNEFDVYINGQYIDKVVYTWTPTDASTQTIVFNTSVLGYGIDPTDTVIIKGRWQ
jgi:hypothetical protein